MSIQLYDAETDQVPDFWVKKYERSAAQYWDVFYRRNQRNFFKDRHYLDREFPMLADANLTVLEVGPPHTNTYAGSRFLLHDALGVRFGVFMIDVVTRSKAHV